MKRRLTLRFILQLVIAGIVVLLFAAICVIWVVQRFADISMSHDFASVGLERLVESSELSEEGIRFDSDLLAQVKKNDGWLQSLDENGRVEKSYNTPADVPKNYDPGELVAYWTGTAPFPYDLYLWIQEKDGKLFTLIYGITNDILPLLEKISTDTSITSAGQLELPAGVGGRIEALGGYVQLLDSEGFEIATYNKPNDIPTQFTIQELALRTMYSDRYGFNVSSSYEDHTGRTWLIGLPNERSDAEGSAMLLPEEIQVLLIGIAAMFAAMLIVFILLSLWNAHRFGVPMIHMLDWLDSLGKSKYEEPNDSKGIPRSRTRSGKWRPRYRIFTEVMHSLDKLSITLQRDQVLRHETNSLRGEWIAGITHDLKTPLSSIKGYAHLLAEPKYEWSMEEVRKYSSNMLNKSSHMAMLISDLEMTYRLTTGVTPPESDVIELNGWLRTALKQIAIHPEYGEGRIRFIPAETEVLTELYTPWLERIVNNLTANALLHNSPDTVLTVTLWVGERGKGMTIQFTDNGHGMDDDTTNRLFERYYRGTDTSTTPNGSGLGMAISKGLVEAMSGQIHVATSLGEGTEIRLIWN
ncbi:sensor histidine kinase [Paenibacillus sp. FA6]|uniref:sensor histidine kinase n=1 Tax=Paenibacillus sp. FA6 TaxID=3413029 RepID=UPI003F65A82C